MNTEQSLAIMLAERLDAETEKTVSIDLMHFEAAAELRRLHAENEVLRKSLEGVMYWDNGKPEWDEARAAIAQPGQQLAEAQRDTVKQIADAAFRHGLSLVKTDTGFELLRLGTGIAAMKGTA